MEKGQNDFFTAYKSISDLFVGNHLNPPATTEHTDRSSGSSGCPWREIHIRSQSLTCAIHTGLLRLALLNQIPGVLVRPTDFCQARASASSLACCADILETAASLQAAIRVGLITGTSVGNIAIIDKVPFRAVA